MYIYICKTWPSIYYLTLEVALLRKRLDNPVSDHKQTALSL